MPIFFAQAQNLLKTWFLKNNDKSESSKAVKATRKKYALDHLTCYVRHNVASSLQGTQFATHLKVSETSEHLAFRLLLGMGCEEGDWLAMVAWLPAFASAFGGN